MNDRANDSNSQNTVVINGKIASKSAVRFTPAGMPVLEFSLLHQSLQQEAGGQRQVQCEVECICLNALAHRLAQHSLGVQVSVSGFLAAKNRRWPNKLVLHMTEFTVLPNLLA